MANAFNSTSRPYSETPDIIFQPIGVYGSRQKGNRDSNKSNVDINKATKHGNISSEYYWLIK